MKKLIMVLVLGLVFTVAYAQTDNPLKKGMPNTVTLSNGEVIYDLSGEWDVIIHASKIYKNIYKITQKGNDFVGIRLIGNEMYPKGEVTIKGELEKDGFKSLQVYNIYGSIASKGKISEKGNKIEIEATIPNVQRSKIYYTLTRK